MQALHQLLRLIRRDLRLGASVAVFHGGKDDVQVNFEAVTFQAGADLVADDMGDFILIGLEVRGHALSSEAEKGGGEADTGQRIDAHHEFLKV